MSTVVRVVVSGPAGGSWTVERGQTGWAFVVLVDGTPNRVTLDQDTAWRLATKGLSPEAARGRVTMTGDPALGAAVLEMVAIIA